MAGCLRLLNMKIFVNLHHNFEIEDEIQYL